METPWWKILAKAAPLIVLILCLFLIWNVNVYKVWWEKFTPWEDLGSPPSGGLKISQLLFPIGFSTEHKPDILVLTRGGTYYCCFQDTKTGWVREYASYTFMDNRKQERIVCAARIEQEWDIEEENLQSVKDVFAQGICSPDGYKYAIYQIKQDGSVWGRYINGERPETYRIGLTLLTCLLIIFYALAWKGVFKRVDLLAPKPDDEAK